MSDAQAEPLIPVKAKKWPLVIVGCVALIVVVGLISPNSLLDLRPSVRAAKAELANVLHDAETAKYRLISVYADGTVCGEVNAKNLMGAYTGFEEFRVKDGQVTIGSTEILAQGGCPLELPDPNGTQRLVNAVDRNTRQVEALK